MQLPLLLPGHHRFAQRLRDYLRFQQIRLQRFDGKSWVAFGDMLGDARVSILPRLWPAEVKEGLTSIISGAAGSASPTSTPASARGGGVRASASVAERPSP